MIHLPENPQSPNPAYHFKTYPDRGWGLVQTKGNFEKQTRRYVESIGLPCYLPLVRKVCSKYRTSYLPIFRNYLFVAWGVNDRRSLVMCNSIVNYIEVPPGCDTDIIAQMESLYKIELLSETREINLQNLLRLPKKRLQTIRSGSLKGFTGYWKELNGKKMFAVIMNVLDSKFEAIMDGTGLICD